MPLRVAIGGFGAIGKVVAMTHELVDRHDVAGTAQDGASDHAGFSLASKENAPGGGPMLEATRRGTRDLDIL